MTATLRAWFGPLVAGLLLCTFAAHAQEGEPVSDEVVRDREFGVSARHFGLERRVAMYQWRAKDGTFERLWSETPIDSTGYAPGHDNPEFPIRGRRWIAERVTLDDKPLDRSVIEQFGLWRQFRPNFSALPGNLAATFQPEGDGLGSAENPLDPQIGDLRIAWRELTLPPLGGRVVLERGAWFPIAGDPVGGAASDAPAASPVAPVFPTPRRQGCCEIIASSRSSRMRRYELGRFRQVLFWDSIGSTSVRPTAIRAPGRMPLSRALSDRSSAPLRSRTRVTTRTPAAITSAFGLANTTP